MSAIDARPEPARRRPAYPVISRPRGAPRATTPGQVPEPLHHHLPAWVRRAHGQAQPILADFLGSLDRAPRAELAASVAEVTELISSGKFSAAWRYPDLIAAGQQLYTCQVRERQAAERERRALDAVRRKAAELLREPSTTLPAETAARLSRELRAASDQAAIEEAAGRIRGAIASARAAHEKRREREIDRTRARIQRSPATNGAAGPGDSWQAVLLRLKEQMAARDPEETAAAE